jgi:hypothetical protein
MKRLLISFTFLLVTTFAFAQIRNVPTEVEDAFAKQYPDAESVVYKDNLVNVRVNFVLNGDRLMATFNNKGMWRETEKDWTFEQLPEDVKDGFHKSKYADWKLTETKVIYRPDGKERYRIKIEKNDVQKKYLLFNQSGRLVEDNITI